MAMKCHVFKEMLNIENVFSLIVFYSFPIIIFFKIQIPSIHACVIHEYKELGNLSASVYFPNQYFT